MDLCRVAIRLLSHSKKVLGPIPRSTKTPFFVWSLYVLPMCEYYARFHPDLFLILRHFIHTCTKILISVYVLLSQALCEKETLKLPVLIIQRSIQILTSFNTVSCLTIRRIGSLSENPTSIQSYKA